MQVISWSTHYIEVDVIPSTSTSSKFIAITWDLAFRNG